jgi:hypothetical protein
VGGLLFFVGTVTVTMLWTGDGPPG